MSTLSAAVVHHRTRGPSDAMKGGRKPGNMTPWRPKRPQLAPLHVSTLPSHSLTHQAL